MSVKVTIILSASIILCTIGQSCGRRLSDRNSGRNSSNPVLDIILPRNNENPLSYLNTVQALAYYGYPSESHSVVTQDGYILTMHRIISEKLNNPRSASNGPRPVVFLQHGLFASSFEWLMNAQHNLLPLKLADAGYDVWFGNARGNAYSRAHLKLNVKNSKFWDFSMNEMGKYDLPAEIDYVLGKTGQSKLHYIGFSMGTAMFFTMMSHHPEYNEKVTLMTALAPVVYLNHVKFPQGILGVLESVPTFKILSSYSRIWCVTNGEFLPPWSTRWYNGFWTRICSNRRVAESVCTRVEFAFAGWDKPQALINQLPLFYSHTPSSMSVRTIMHLLQFFHNGVFQEYDFGESENQRKYGKPKPPKYNLKNTRIPVALLYGPNDAIVNPIDVKRLSEELPNVVVHSPINFKYWNHFDYHLGRDADLLVNQRLLKLLAKFQ